MGIGWGNVALVSGKGMLDRELLHQCQAGKCCAGIERGNVGCVVEMLEKLHIDSPNFDLGCCEAFAVILQRSQNLEDIKGCVGSLTK